MTAQSDQFVERVRLWAQSHQDIRALLLVGSHARHQERADSDIDIVVVTTDQARYLHDTAWVSEFGVVSSVQLEPYPPTTSVRVVYEGGLEVEFGIAPDYWASPPFDGGTLRVARDGIQILLDREGHATELARVVHPV